MRFGESSGGGAEESIRGNFEAHAERVEKLVQKIAEDDKGSAGEIASRMETSLRAHAQILSRLGRDKKEVKESVAGFGAQMRAHGNAALKIRIAAEAGIATSTALEPDREFAARGAMNAAGNKIGEVKEFFENKNDELDIAIKAEVEARLGTAEDLFAEGQAKYEAHAFADAFVFFQRARAVAQRAKILVVAHKEFDIDVRDPLRVNLEEKATTSGREVNRDDNAGFSGGDDDDFDDDNDGSDEEIEGMESIDTEIESGSGRGSNGVRIPLFR